MKRELTVLLYCDDCIVAIATPFAKGGLGVVRISGKGAVEKASKIFKPFKHSSLLNLKGYEAAYGVVVDLDGCKVDDCVALVFLAPHSYTGEEVVEISCHGGIAILNLILKLCVQVGCRLALGGEFTKRAFLNGKLSLTQAEAVIDLINAESSLSLKSAIKMKEGFLFKKSQDVYKCLIEINSQIEAYLNFPDEGVDEPDVKQLILKINESIDSLNTLILSFQSFDYVKNGVRTVLIGAPNVGKSTLMNLIVGEQVSIVTKKSGTTRDVITKLIEIDGINFTFFDTAGIRLAKTEVEQIGIAKAKKELRHANLILHVIDSSKRINKSVMEKVQNFTDTMKILILNKVDLKKMKKPEFIENYDYVVETTKYDLKSVQKLKNVMSKIVREKIANFGVDVVVNERQKSLIEKVIAQLQEIKALLVGGTGLDAVSVSLEAAMEQVLKLNGQNVNDEIIDTVFSKFCVGK